VNPTFGTISEKNQRHQNEKKTLFSKKSILQYIILPISKEKIQPHNEVKKITLTVNNSEQFIIFNQNYHNIPKIKKGKISILI
jgi:hypothetical protein